MKTLEIQLSDQALRLLKQLAGYGIYGATKEEAAARLVDQGLIRLLEKPVLKLKLKRSRK